MICQQIFLKAEIQLLSLFGKRVSQTKVNRFSLIQSALQNCQSKRCFTPVSPPPAASEVRKHEEQPGERIVQMNMNDNKESDKNTVVDENDDKHIPVMVNEVLSCLEPKCNQLIVDMTFGAGGHARHILKSCPDVRYIGMDRDPLAFGLAQSFATHYREGQIIPLLSKFSELPVHLEQLDVVPGTVDCVLMDLGVSSMQFDEANRGFGLSRDGPLDMRMDGVRFPDNPTAADVVNTLEPHDIARILKKYGEEKKAKAIAHAIVEAKYAFGPFTSTKQLAGVIKSVFESTFRHDKLHRHSHVATKTFQALRIFVNDELNELHNGLQVAHHILKPNGRCAVISFHSLEDRIVKRHFHGIDMDLSSNISLHNHFRSNDEIRQKFLSRDWQPLQRKIMEPSEKEVLINPRSRSAKLRVAIKLEQDHDCASD